MDPTVTWYYLEKYYENDNFKITFWVSFMLLHLLRFLQKHFLQLNTQPIKNKSLLLATPF